MYLIIKHIYIGELPLHEVLIRILKAWVVNDKDLCFFSFFILIDLLYSIELDFWINPKGFISRRRLAQRIGGLSLDIDFLTDGLGHGQKWDVFIQHKLIINRTSGSNITIPHLRESWLKRTSASFLDKSLDKTKVSEMCCLEMVSYIRLKGQRVNPMTYWKDQVTGGEVSSEFPKFPEFCGKQPPKASHINP